MQYNIPIPSHTYLIVNPPHSNFFPLPPVLHCHPPSGWKSESRGGQKGRENFRKPPFLTRPIALPRHDRGVSASHGARRGRGRGKAMLRIRTGARDGLRWGLFGFVAAFLTLTNDATQAAPSADIVGDANSGAILHATNPDARRHPASLTKIMTLYLLFEQLEAGKLKLDSALKVSSEAAGQAPTKLGLKPGSTLVVEDAIKGIDRKSVV